MALLVWCLGIATIYPPGALIVTFEAHMFTENYNMSVLNPPVPQNLDLAANDTFPTLGSPGLITMNADEYFPRQRAFMYSGPKETLVNVAQSIVTNNQMFNLVVHPGENSTFHLKFRGPQLRCTTSRFNGTIPLEYRTQGSDEINDDAMTGLVFVSRWDPKDLSYSVTQQQILNFTMQRDSDNVTSYNAIVETSKQTCEAVSALFSIEVTFPRGVQTVQVSMNDIRPMPTSKDIFDKEDSGLPGIWLVLPPESPALEDWRQRILAALPISNEWALLDALGSVLAGKFYEDSPRAFPDDCQEISNPNNDTKLYDCWGWGGFTPYNPANFSTPLKGTVFETARFKDDNTDWYFDPRTALNITEELLNSVLTNITLSVLSLETWWDMVLVNTTRYRSTYSFANPLNLILPYSICLLAAAIFAVIAIWSLWQSGTPAADGGFLQIMIATRGNTEMERLTLRERLGGVDDISEELKSLKIRYGELVTENVLGTEGRRLGFGTAEETLSDRKGWQ
ncbi:hypothetical protein NX059_010680 [Plenodomus lindquistii]|nr:hypothetical protein NX059_010680 [Plenodomus lindquistii]